MVFPSQEEQIEKFEKDHVAQHYFEVLRTLISKKSVFARENHFLSTFLLGLVPLESIQADFICFRLYIKARGGKISPTSLYLLPNWLIQAV